MKKTSKRSLAARKTATKSTTKRTTKRARRSKRPPFVVPSAPVLGDGTHNYLQVAQEVLAMEAAALTRVAGLLNAETIQKTVDLFSMLHQTGGKLIFCGVGKSGVIAEKLAATFTSLGLPSFFLHPVEALHGDLGRASKEDVICFISKSGTTEEIMRLMPFLPMPFELRIGLLGASGTIAKHCAVVFDCSVEREACLNNQAPTSSSTVALAMGDALAVVYENLVGLTKQGFAVNHPGGILGKSLIMKVRDLMWEKQDCPVLGLDANLQDVVLAMTKNPVGGLAIIDAEDHLLGIIVEGDIRRSLTKGQSSLQTAVGDIMNPHPICIGPAELAFKALEKMEKRANQISILPVIDPENHFLGFIRLHDLWHEGLLLK